ncbi:hypothetical protein LJK87_32195 [Paenibacillus sp. P25]|nr:hypothetical protein LJK87_32195 [Paenibacillus sp. P25]
MLEQESLRQLGSLDVRKALTVITEGVLERKYDEKTFDAALDIAERWAHQESTVRKMGSSP